MGWNRSICRCTRLRADPRTQSACALSQLATPESDYNPAQPPAEQIGRAVPRYSAKTHHIYGITRLLLVTESIGLPPRPKAVNMTSLITESGEGLNLAELVREPLPPVFQRLT